MPVRPVILPAPLPRPKKSCWSTATSWSAPGRDFRSGNRTLFAKARAGKMGQVSSSMSERGTRASDQHAVWAHVAQKSEALRVESPTMSMSDLYDGRSGELDGYAAAFHAEPGQCGAVS